ncbi:MAG: lipid export permease/ATP-binding protein MsbA [Pseudomonadota bacterium]
MTKADRALYLRLLGFIKPYWKAFSIAVVCMVLTASTEPVFPAIMKYLLDSGFHTADANLVWLIPSFGSFPEVLWVCFFCVVSCRL